ncbi:MAG TPA: ABC transporter ATP-binding protein [Deltaproteobacteria bacterium]|nr:ABC transporter ATP-binding protein [Deltaproteobacteria bacterium]
MATLLSVIDLTHAYNTRPLFSKINFAIESGERVGLIGPNGAGKSTLLQILAGKIQPDSGQVAINRGLKIGFLEQMPQFSPHSSVISTVLEGAFDPHDGGSITLAYELLSKLQLDGSLPGSENIHSETLISELSGGWKKRVALARELMREPDLLLLDEPTNHLDVESILWLEDFISRAPFATLTITHDRFFLQRVATRILELDRRNPGGLLSAAGHYEDYLKAKEDLMNAQEKQETALKNTLRREIEWLRSGTKARTTKQQARIQRAGELANQVSELEYRNTVRTVGIDFSSSDRQPKKLLEAKGLTKNYGRALFENLNLLITPGTRLGLLGANGCGKSTLIRILLGKEKPDAGEVFRSDHLSVAYFEQNRESLDPKIHLTKTLAPHGDQVIYRGKPIHIRGYLDRFLFTQTQMNMPVGQLSGGEQSRLLIARLMLTEANLLILDEPTNDLDLASLGILEDCLTEFDGSVILVTHDRFFLDRVATKILAFHPLGGGSTHYFADLSQWETWHKQALKVPEKKNKATQPKISQDQPKKKLSFKEQRELDGMEEKIQKQESELEYLTAQMALPEINSNAPKLLEISQTMGKIQKEIETLYARWAQLLK